jgi:pyruvate-ferredoxin/flavodoxin oxidoreductase
MLWRTHPEEAEKFLAQSQQEVRHRYHYYQQLASLPWNEEGDVEPPHRKLKAAVEKTTEQAS